jgi:hypothetical protein
MNVCALADVPVLVPPVASQALRAFAGRRPKYAPSALVAVVVVNKNTALLQACRLDVRRRLGGVRRISVVLCRYVCCVLLLCCIYIVR